MKANIHIKNRKAWHNFEILETYTAGMMLQGTEIKSIRQGKANLVDSYCHINKGELYVKNLHIAEYDHGNIANHEPMRERKLLLSKRELLKIEKKLKDQGVTIIPLSLFINERGWAKLEIGLAKGKKQYDKRASLKDKQLKREVERVKSIK